MPRKYQDIGTAPPAALPLDTDVFAVFDATSMSVPDANSAASALTAWHSNLSSEIPGYVGGLYIIPYANEDWVAWPKRIYNKTVIEYSNATWDTVAPTYRVNWATFPATINKIFLLAFIDETHTAYHNSTTFVNEPTTAFKTDYTDFIQWFQSLSGADEFFQGICYPIVKSNTGKQFIIHSLGAMYGRTLSADELSTLYTVSSSSPHYVDVSILQTTNPYTDSELGQTNCGLLNYNWQAFWSKTSPASNVFSGDEFNKELNSTLTKGKKSVGCNVGSAYTRIK